MKLEQAISNAGRVCDLWLPMAVRYARLPGMAVGIVHRGKLVYSAGFGYADLETRQPMLSDTAFRIASNSKTFAAVGIMQLQEAGKLRLDDTIASHLKWFKPSGKTTSPITIRQILSHTAGVYRDATSPHWDTDEFPDVAGLKRSAGVKADIFENLTRWKYSNFGFALIGEVIKKVSGQTFNAYMREHIIEPLGLTRTEPDLTRESRAWLATPHGRPLPDSDVREVFEHAQAKSYAAATGFLSNVPDLAKYIAALSLSSGKLLNRESKKEMYRQMWSTGDPSGEAYGLGFFISKIGSRTVVGHSGGFPGFITNQSFDPTDDLGVIVLTNGNDSPADLIRRGIYSMIDRVASGSYGSKDTVASLRPYEGVYRGRWTDMCVARIDHTLIAFPVAVDAPMSAATVLRRKGKHSFVMDSKFGGDSPGELARFTVSGDRATKMVYGANPFTRLHEA